MSMEVDLLLQEAKESIEAAQNYRSELQQRLHGLNQARKQVLRPPTGACVLSARPICPPPRLRFQLLPVNIAAISCLSGATANRQAGGSEPRAEVMETPPADVPKEEEEEVLPHPEQLLQFWF